MSDNPLEDLFGGIGGGLEALFSSIGGAFDTPQPRGRVSHIDDSESPFSAISDVLSPPLLTLAGLLNGTGNTLAGQPWSEDYDPFGVARDKAKFHMGAGRSLASAVRSATGPQMASHAPADLDFSKDEHQFTLDVIKKFEGYAPVAKWDYQQFTGGYGTRGAAGQRYTRESAQADLEKEVSSIAGYMDKHVTAPLNKYQRAALTSFAFNTGVGSLGRLLPEINAGNWDAVGERMQGWVKAGGKVHPVLVGRRADERGILMRPLDPPVAAAVKAAAMPEPPPSASGAAKNQSRLVLPDKPTLVKSEKYRPDGTLEE